MAVEEDKKLTEQAFIAALYERPISKETSRSGQVVVLLGFIELAVVYFGATLEPTSAWPIKFPNSGTVLPLVLFCACFAFDKLLDAGNRRLFPTT
jgi:hypothetical protein